MTLSFIRCFFVIISGLVGYYIGNLLAFQDPLKDLDHLPVLGAQIGCVSGLILIFIERQLQRVSVRGLSSVVFGLILGVFMAKLISNILALLPLNDFILSVSEITLTLVFSYIGAVMALRGKDEFNIIIPYVRFKRQDVRDSVILLDTSAIIDGRIADVQKTHFISGRLVVPRSVLAELQSLADSADDNKRQKGRRGLDILQAMQNDPKTHIHIHEDEISSNMTVDSKLMQLAKVMDGSICTTDYNLGQTATVQGIEVLNINELASAVKSAVFTGDEVSISLIKEGKENDQAVGYLEDGTMVVVSGAKKYIGEEVRIKVTSVLQTQAGRMVFAKLI